MAVGASDTWGPTIGYPEGDTPCMSDTLEFRAVRRRRHAAAAVVFATPPPPVITDRRAAAAADSIEAARRAAHSFSSTSK